MALIVPELLMSPAKTEISTRPIGPVPSSAAPPAVIVPELVRTRWYHYLLHNQTATVIKAYLLFSGFRRVVVVNVPW